MNNNISIPTLQDVIDDYMFYCVSTKSLDKIPKRNRKSTMVEEMNNIKALWESSGKTDDDRLNVLKECVRQPSSPHNRRMTDRTATDTACRLASDKKLKIALKSRTRIFIDFEDLYHHVKTLIGPFHGIGPLAVYDCSKRIGHLLRNPVYPREYVYLSAGAKKGSDKLLANDAPKGFRVPTRLYHPFFGTLPSVFIEDILCVYEHEMRL